MFSKILLLRVGFGRQFFGRLHAARMAAGQAPRVVKYSKNERNYHNFIKYPKTRNEVISGIFLVYDFWTPPSSINFVHGSDKSVLTNLTRGRSA